MMSSPTKNSILSSIKSNKALERRSLNIVHDDPTSNTSKNIFVAPSNSSSNNSKYHNRASPPFRVGGRGSKQLTKVLQQSEESVDDSDCENSTSDTNWMLCTSSPICFAKVVSILSPDKTMIQPLKLHSLDSTLLVPWEGHVWLTKNENLIPVKMKKEALGYKVHITPFIRQWIDTLTKRGEKLAYPISLQTAMNSKNDDWDMVSLESSELEDANSGIFPYLTSNQLVNVNTSWKPNPAASSMKLPQLLPVFEKVAKSSSSKPYSLQSDNTTSSDPIILSIDTSASSSADCVISASESRCSTGDYISTPIMVDKSVVDHGLFSLATTKSADTIASASGTDLQLVYSTDKPKSRAMSFDGNSTTDDGQSVTSYESLPQVEVDDNQSYYWDEQCLEIENRTDNESMSSVSQTPRDSTSEEHINMIHAPSVEKSVEISNSHMQADNFEVTHNEAIGIAMMPRKSASLTSINEVNQPSKRRRVNHVDEDESVKPPRPSRNKSLSYQERTAIFGSWVSRKQSAANGSWKVA